MLTFVIGGLYTLVVLAAGCVVGYLVGKSQSSEVAQTIKREREFSKAKPESGSIKPYTKEELANQKDKAVQKMGELLNRLHDND